MRLMALEEKQMRRIALLAVVASLFIGVLAAPAMADKPVGFVDGVSFDDVNACTGEAHTVNLTFNITVRDNNNNQIVTIKTDAATSDGWYGGGTQTVVENSRVVNDTLNLWARNGEGGAYKVHGLFKLDLDTGEVLMDVLDIDCRK